MTTIKSILEDDARALDAETLDAIARDAGNRAYCEPLRAEEIFKEALEAATVLERERGNAWRAAHDVVKLELDRRISSNTLTR